MYRTLRITRVRVAWRQRRCPSVPLLCLLQESCSRSHRVISCALQFRLLVTEDASAVAESITAKSLSVLRATGRTICNNSQSLLREAEDVGTAVLNWLSCVFYV
jgi:hypothetical protein